MRVWPGVMWIQAGDAKLWGKENAAFLHNGGAGVAGFAAHDVAAYGWWGNFLHHFVVPNAGWIGILVALSEFIIGLALAAGFFTRWPYWPASACYLPSHVRHGQCVRLVCPVRHRAPRLVEDRQLAGRRRPDGRLLPAAASPLPRCRRASPQHCAAIYSGSLKRHRARKGYPTQRTLGALVRLGRRRYHLAPRGAPKPFHRRSWRTRPVDEAAGFQ
jgi:hypothetical protein